MTFEDFGLNPDCNAYHEKAADIKNGVEYGLRTKLIFLEVLLALTKQLTFLLAILRKQYREKILFMRGLSGYLLPRLRTRTIFYNQ